MMDASPESGEREFTACAVSKGMYLILYRHCRSEGWFRGEGRRRLCVGCSDNICFFTFAHGFIYAFDYADVQMQVLNVVLLNVADEVPKF